MNEPSKKTGDLVKVTGLLVAPNGSKTRITINVDEAAEQLAVLIDAPGITYQQCADNVHTVWFLDDNPDSYLPSELDDLRFDDRPNIVGKRLAGLDEIPMGNVVFVGGRPGDRWTDVNLDILGVAVDD